MPWYTFQTPATAPSQAAFAQLWSTVLFRSREACLFGGAATPRGQLCYMGVPEGAEDLVMDFLNTHRAMPLHGVPEETEVELLVGDEARAKALWEERITCSRENPEGCAMCSG
ncbi:MAG: hypothetical protein KDC00_04925 [Flavobacteriales bacterium]|nr:hypothetical protein [Flavobacteriales bacterium]